MSGWQPGTVTSTGSIRGADPRTVQCAGVVYIPQSEVEAAKAAGWKLRSLMGHGLAMVERQHHGS